MTLNQRGKRTTVLDPTVGLIKELTVRGTGLYGGVVRDLKDPSKKAISGKRFNSIKQLFCVLLILIVCGGRGGHWSVSLLFVGRLLASETEREILEILGVPWQEPHERVRGNFV